MTDWTKEEDEAFNEVEKQSNNEVKKQSNFGKQILQAQGQPYHWAAEATKAAVNIEREECARLCDEQWKDAIACGDKAGALRCIGIRTLIRARGNT